MKLTWTIPASREEVFSAWTNANLMTTWMNADPAWRVQVESDPRLEGKVRSEVIAPDGGKHVTTGEYVEFEPGARFAVTHAYQGPGASGGVPTFVAFDFRETQAGQTQVTLTHSQLSNEEECEAFRAGWTDLMQTLETYYSRSAGNGRGGDKGR